MNLFTPLSQISGIGSITQQKLKKLGIKTIRDLFYHFPHRYEDFSNLVEIKNIKLDQPVTIRGKILDIKTSRTWKRKLFITEAIVEDKTGAIKIVWFNQPYLTKILKKGNFVSLASKSSIGKNGVYLASPAYEKINDLSEPIHTEGLVAVYPETEGLSSRWLRKVLKPLLAAFSNKIPESLPEEILKKYQFMPVNKAFWQVHFPNSLSEAQIAKERFAFEELFFIELFVLKEKIKLKKSNSPEIPINLPLIQKFVKSLPYKLTDAQRKCSWQILKDMEKSHPMNRLLEGDVGSGKTVVATIAALNCAKAGYQVAFMAPTEILAKQHFKEVSKLLFPFKLKIALLTGKEDQITSVKLKNETIAISRQKILEKCLGSEIDPHTKRGQGAFGAKSDEVSPRSGVGVDILIGTHALIQDQVRFKNLGLVIVDEQHRFGVEQRAKLTKQKAVPHLLSMTATPIPRTLALTIYGDLDLSIIDQLPKGRKKIITKVIAPNKRKSIYEFIRKQIGEGRQAFVICPRIEKSKTHNLESKTQKEDFLGWAEVKAVKEEYERLSKEIFPDLRVAMLHGRMKTKEKEKIMKNFKNQKTDILVSTSVVEVGIDVPNATVMAIEGAERFGLAQLHQFRGRVGRSIYQSYCFLFTDSPAKKTRQRLEALIQAQNGFELSEKDLEIRGPGELSGKRQWGIPDLAMSSLKNMPLVEKTREAAKEILEKDYTLKKYPLLSQRLDEFQKRIHLE